MSAFYFFYQPVPESTWEIQLASERINVEKSIKPAFVTVLDLDTSFSEGQVPQGDEIYKVRYRGPFYADFDSPSLDDVIPQFKKFLGNLHKQGLNLEQCYLYATGGKGFHIEVPYRCFVDKKVHADVAMLPLIYKEMAQDLYVDTLDLRVYSARKGRMWRTEGVQRPNGMYKVRITVDEAREMNPDLYRKLCSAPRHLPAVPEPTFCPGLALLYNTSKERYEGSLSKRKAAVKSRAELKSRYNGNWPPLALKVMSGVNINPKAGFQAIATQLAITAHALGMQETDLISASADLCEHHISDGTRYNTPDKRRRELSRMYGYMADNPGYEYSPGAMKNLLETPEDEKDEDTTQQEDYEVVRGFKINALGMFAPRDGEDVKVCSMGMDNPVRLIDLRDNTTIGYDVELFISGRTLGHHMLGMIRLNSKTSFQQWTMEKASASVQATDNQVATIADILRAKSMKENREMYIISREGLDVIKLPIKQGQEPETDVVWAAKDQVISRNGNAYRWRNETNSNGFGTDIHHAPVMEDNETSRKFIKSLFEMNSPINMALLLGWHGAAFLNTWIRSITNEFPTLHVWGEASAGKSKTMEIMGHLFYYHTKPQITQASATTNFSFVGIVTGSASIPVIIDEYKPRDMNASAAKFIRTGLINSNYTGHAINRGSVGSESGAKSVRVNGFDNTAPLVIIAEAQETTSAVVDRTVVVPMTVHYRTKNKNARPAFEFAYAHKHLLSGIGRKMLEVALYDLQDAQLREIIYRNRKLILDEVIRTRGTVEGSERPISNLSVVLTGLNLLSTCLYQIFGTYFDEDITRLMDVVVHSAASTISKQGKRSEASKVINTLARISYLADENLRLEQGVDYSIGTDYVDLAMRNCYAKYARYCRTFGQEILFDNEDAFMSAMLRYSGMVDELPDNEELRPNPMVEVFRFSNTYLDKEGLEYFKGR